jgi:hypothetical protein
VQKERCVLLERGGAPTCEPTHYVIGGSTLSTSYPHVSTRGSLWDKWQPHFNTWLPLPLQVVRPPSTIGAPSFTWLLHILLFIQALSHLQSSWSLGIAACSCILLEYFLFGIKRLWRSRRCVIHVCGCLMSICV